MKKALKYGLIALVGLVVIGALAGPSDTNSTQQSQQSSQVQEKKEANSTTTKKPTKTPVPVVKVNLASFVKEFDANQLAAEQKYEGKIIQTTGYVDNISEDIVGDYYIILNPTSDKYYFGTQLQCYFDDKKSLLHIKNGQKVTVQGKFDTQEMNILVKHCVLK